MLCLLIAYPVAYYTARSRGRHRELLLAPLIAPFWISYMMRMLAWVNLLQNDGLVNRTLSSAAFTSTSTGSPAAHVVVLGLVYGYVPYMILPLYAGLDRFQPNVLEAARDLGAGRLETFRRVTLPLTAPAIIAAVLLTCLPMLGDYFTADLLSGSPSTTMVGNLINNSVLDPRPDRPGRRVRAARPRRLPRADALLRPQRPQRGSRLVTIAVERAMVEARPELRRRRGLRGGRRTRGGRRGSCS